MANLQFVQENRLRAEATPQPATRNMTSRVLWGLSINILLALTLPPLLLIGIPAALVACFLGCSSPRTNPVKLAGAAGEDYTLVCLDDLSDDYTVFNQVVVPDPASRHGWRELDFVVTGPNGVFVVECKNFKGRLEGNAEDREWRLHKMGQGGTAYTVTVTNAVRQVGYQVQALRAYLKSQNVAVPVVPVVALAANNDTAEVVSPRIPVLGADQVAERIRTYLGRSIPVAQTVAALVQLREVDCTTAFRTAA